MPGDAAKRSKVELEAILHEPDAAMNTEIVLVIRDYIDAGGDVESALVALTQGYQGFAQMINLGVCVCVRVCACRDAVVRAQSTTGIPAWPA